MHLIYSILAISWCTTRFFEMHTPSTLLEQSPKLYKEATRVKQSDGEETGGCSGTSGSHKQKWPSWLNFPIWIENWPRWLASKRQTNPQTSSLVTRPDQSLAWANLVYSHCVCVGVFGNFAKKPHQTDVPTDIKGNCEEPTTTLRESSCVSLCKSKQIQYASVRHLAFFV